TGWSVRCQVRVKVWLAGAAATVVIAVRTASPKSAQSVKTMITRLTRAALVGFFLLCLAVSGLIDGFLPQTADCGLPARPARPYGVCIHPARAVRARYLSASMRSPRGGVTGLLAGLSSA